MIFWYLLLAFLIIFVPVWLSYEYFQLKTGVPTFPTMPSMRKKIIEVLKMDFDARPENRPYRIIDLGSGSGQLSWRIAKLMPEAEIIGIEISFIPWLRSVLRQRLFGPKNLSYQRIDFWPYDISSAHAVITYLPGTIMERVGIKLQKELKPGTLVLAATFALKAGWEPYETFDIRVPMKVKLSLYRQK